MTRKPFHLFSNALAFKLSLALGIFMNIIILLGFLYNNSIEDSVKLRMSYTIFTDIVLSYLLYSFSFKIIQLDLKDKLKLWYVIGGSLVIVGISNIIITKGTLLLFHSNLIPDDFLIAGNIIKVLLELIIVLLTTLLLYSTSQRQQTLLENEKLIADNIHVRYEVLKNQVDPHFLFNSLNTLDGLIGLDDERAHDYLQNLSQVFRYSIGNKWIINLDEELDFTKSYAHLMQIRYGENIQIKYNIDEKYRNWYVVPISLQLLVENAIKHNVISTKYPLIITIETTPIDSITISNVIQSKKEAEQGEGIGLVNLTERYELLFQKEVSIIITDVFSVEIPLIKDLEETKFKNRNEYEGSNNRR